LILFLPAQELGLDPAPKLAKLTLVQAMDATTATGFGGYTIEAGHTLVE
jgi:hypothetical protein